jgi:hypothetical protein
MKELIDIQSVMERNPGLPSRINTKQLNDIQSNLQYLQAMVRDLQNSGALKPTTIESFADMGPLPSETPASLKELQDFQVKVVFELNNLNLGGAQDQASLLRVATLNRIKQDVDQVIAQVQGGILAPSSIPIFSVDLQQAGAFLGQPAKRSPINTGTPSAPVPTDTTLTSDKPASLKQLQEFQVKVVVEIERLSASGTSDPIVKARLAVLQKIKQDVDQVIQKLQSGEITPATVPILQADVERAFPILGNPTAPLPTILKKADLPAQLSSLFPGGLSPRDDEQMKQINNIVSGYAKKFMDGASWQVSLKYDNPDIEKIRLKTAEQTAKLVDLAKELGVSANQGGLPGVAPSANPPLQAQDARAQATAPANMRQAETNAAFDRGLPGLSTSRNLPLPPPATLDWKQRNREIVQQIRRRGMDPITFGAMPDDAEVSKNFSWRGHTQMMCSRLNQTADPGLAVSVGCPPQGWEGWRT